MKLTLRKDVKDNQAYYELEVIEGISYSVVDFGNVMKSAPKFLRSTTFQGWEAIPVKPDGGLDSDTILRANTKKELLTIIESKHKQDMGIFSTIKEAVSVAQPVITKEVGTYYTIKPERVGSISHTFLINNGRATRYDNEYSKEATKLPLNSAATIEEVESLISVLLELRRMMKNSQ